MYLMPIMVNYGRIQALATEVVVGGGAGSIVRMGVYADSGWGWPKTLLREAPTTVDGTAVATPSVAITPVSPPLGIVWLAQVPQVAAPTQRIWGHPVMQMLFPTAADALQLQVYAYIMAGVSGALPSTLTYAGLTRSTSGPKMAAQLL
jgi:hypothetical protein